MGPERYSRRISPGGGPNRRERSNGWGRTVHPAPMAFRRTAHGCNGAAGSENQCAKADPACAAIGGSLAPVAPKQ